MKLSFDWQSHSWSWLEQSKGPPKRGWAVSPCLGCQFLVFGINDLHIFSICSVSMTMYWVYMIYSLSSQLTIPNIIPFRVHLDNCSPSNY